MAGSSRKTSRRTIRLQSALLVANAADLHKEVITAIHDGKGVTVDMRELNDIDTAGTQLVLAMACAARDERADIRLTGAPACLRDAANRLGLDLGGLNIHWEGDANE